MNTGEYLSIQLHKMDKIIQYERFYKKNTHTKTLQSKILQHKIRHNNLKQSKDKTKGSFNGRGYVIDPIFEVEY